MDVFKTHDAVMNDYRSFIESFINIADERIKKKVASELLSGKLWPDPLIQFNPSFEEGASITSLIEGDILHPAMNDIFNEYRLYQHQVEAIQLGSQGRDFVVTSGTGSGKSLTYIGTIFNHILKNPEHSEGINAIIVYPMNALINSQTLELEKYRRNYEERTGQIFPITSAQYTGQEREARRQEIIADPPNILLTNYMMLELLLSRVRDILRLRNIHKQMDELVLRVYGWHENSDYGPAVDLEHDFYEVDYLPENDRIRYTISPEARKEILKRLLKVNHEIHKQEVEENQNKKKSAKKKKTEDLPLLEKQ